jgi:drug/metabolite transporter (DMT)-like permease
VGLAFGLGAALCWGLADFFAALAARRIGTLRVVIGFHALAMAVLAAMVIATGALADVGWADLPPFVFIGGIGWLSYMAFYGALKAGPVSVVSPIVSGYAMVTVVLAVVIGGERPTAAVVAAAVLVIGGVILASGDVLTILPGQHERLSVRGPALGLLAMALIGGFVYGLAHYAEEFGWLVPIFLGRGFALVFLFGHALTTGKLDLPDRSARMFVTIAFLALTDTAGYVLFNVGVRHADTSLVSAASAPYALVPIVLGVALLAERPSRPQWTGVGLVLAGIVALGLAG